MVLVVGGCHCRGGWVAVVFVCGSWVFGQCIGIDGDHNNNEWSLLLFNLTQVPFDSGRLVFPPVAAGVLAAIFYNVFAILLPLAVARSIFAGGLLGYITYDLMHYYLHHGSPTPGSYLHQLKRYHVSHHFEDQQKGGLNLTTRILKYCNLMKCCFCR